jgi:hypothetical protein
LPLAVKLKSERQSSARIPVAGGRLPFVYGRATPISDKKFANGSVAIL